MRSPKENFLRLLNNDDPQWLGDPWSCFNLHRGWPRLPDAVTYSINRPVRGEVGKKDVWGVIWDWPDDQPGAVPRNSADDDKVIKDITRWKDFFEFPPLDNLDWDRSVKDCGELDRENKLVLVHSSRGMFEFSHTMMGMEDGLANYLLEPDHMYELLDAYTDWKIESVKVAIDVMRPDIMMNFDDWGSKNQLFIPPDAWRAILKPLYKRFYAYIKSRGVIVMQHCDSHADEVAEDMAEIGVDIWQGTTPENDIPGVIKRTEGKLFIMGGTDMPLIDIEGIDEEIVRAHIRSVYDKYAPCGHFIPCCTNVIPMDKRVWEIFSDEMNRYGAVMAERLFGGK